jgi:death-on-curing protein
MPLIGWVYVDLGQFLVFAERISEVAAERLVEVPGLVGRADSALSAPKAAPFGEEQYPDFAMKAAMLCPRLIKNHPLWDGNMRVAFLCMTEFIEANGFELVVDDPDHALRFSWVSRMAVFRRASLPNG